MADHPFLDVPGYIDAMMTERGCSGAHIDLVKKDMLIHAMDQILADCGCKDEDDYLFLYGRGVGSITTRKEREAGRVLEKRILIVGDYERWKAERTVAKLEDELKRSHCRCSACKYATLQRQRDLDIARRDAADARVDSDRSKDPE